MEAWRCLFEAHRLLVAKLDADMQQRHGLPLMRYEALSVLRDADMPLRMNELADRFYLSRSAATRFVDRLERDGLVQRRLSQQDRRGMEVVLTPRGSSLVEQAEPTHKAGVMRYFGANLRNRDVDALTGALRSVLGRSDR